MIKSVLIFGAGVNQVNLIKAARELQIESVVIDPDSQSPGKYVSDFFYCVDGKDYISTREIALKHRVAGIVTGQMEKPLRIMSQLAQELNFIFHTQEVVERSLNKFLMKKAFLANGVPCAVGKLIGKDKKIGFDELDILKFPLILKPKDATSSQGVYKIDSFGEIDSYAEVTRSFSSNGDIILEEYLEGPEISVEAITFRGKTNIVQYTEKFTTPFPRFVEIGHHQPANLTEFEKLKVDKIVNDAIKAIGIDNSASHTEIKLTKSGPKVLEIGARLGGDFIASYLTLHSCGVDMDKAAIQVAFGNEPDLKKRRQKHSYIKYLELESGKTITNIDEWNDIIKYPEVIYAHVSIKVGDFIHEITESAKRPGFVIVEGDNRDESIQIAEKYLEIIKSKIKLR